MATQAVLRVTIYILALPLVVVSQLMIQLRLCGLHEDLKRCLTVVDSAPSLPSRFVVTLVAAEDHRNSIHPGVDPIAMFRAFMVWVRSGRAQGASTIEQQLVRVVLGCYERTLRRKLREQLVAIALSYKRSKPKIAEAYLSNAFYGSGFYGLAALTYVCKPNLETTSQDNISHMVARLKYPKPLSPTTGWHQKIKARVRYIAVRLQRPTNPSFHQSCGKSRVGP
jgi:penicillin-binding protein 1A